MRGFFVFGARVRSQSADLRAKLFTGLDHEARALHLAREPSRVRCVQAHTVSGGRAERACQARTADERAGTRRAYRLRRSVRLHAGPRHEVVRRERRRHRCCPEQHHQPQARSISLCGRAWAGALRLPRAVSNGDLSPWPIRDWCEAANRDDDVSRAPLGVLAIERFTEAEYERAHGFQIVSWVLEWGAHARAIAPDALVAQYPTSIEGGATPINSVS